MLVFKRSCWKLSTYANKWRWKFPWQFCLCIKNCRGNLHDHFLCLSIQKLSYKFPRPFSPVFGFKNRRGNFHDYFASVFGFKNCSENFQDHLCLQILKWCWKFPIHFVFANTEMVLEISNTFCVWKY